MDTASPIITAVLGPTNTGKTHYAIERMLSYKSGIIGFPLRLLARENYDRVVEQKGKQAVALITGEEKILPEKARYFLCTVESMPTDKSTEFLAVDEIQLISDQERGHVFTNRLLNARGTRETIFLGASTVETTLKKVLPGIKYISRPRLSKLKYSGSKKITRLPKKTAIVAFSAQDVYALADLIRKQKGGAVVVLGALSPRTRNSQVEMYQNGEVDYLVATDAIGMGLNLNINHVAFAQRVKFDGIRSRHLSPQELAQIAGRAGRHLNDGTFGVTADCSILDEAVVEAIENHNFKPQLRAYWRNTDLSFESLSSLIHSLELSPPYSFMTKKRDAADHTYLVGLSKNKNIASRASNKLAVRLLWDVCQIPDFSKTLSESHSYFLEQVFNHLQDNNGELPENWVAKQIQRFNRTDGDIDTLSSRLAHIRNWTYISNRNNWTRDPLRWQEETRAVEDRLSDALHEKLTQRFVDLRASVLVRKMQDSHQLLAGISLKGEVSVEGYKVGNLNGLSFSPNLIKGSDPKPVLAAVRRVLPTELKKRAQDINNDIDEKFSIDTSGSIYWRSNLLAYLALGHTPLSPKILLRASDLISLQQEELIISRLRIWLDHHINECLNPLVRIKKVDVASPARGILFQISENLGMVLQNKVKNLLKNVSQVDRNYLTKLGLRFGTEVLYFPELLKPKAIELLSVLWRVHNSSNSTLNLPLPGQVTVEKKAGVSDEYYLAIGFVPLGNRAVRADILERVAVILRQQAKAQPFVLEDKILSLLGLGYEETKIILREIGYIEEQSVAGKRMFKRKSQRGQSRRKKGGYRSKQVDKTKSYQNQIVSKEKGQNANSNSPFAILKNFRLEQSG